MPSLCLFVITPYWTSFIKCDKSEKALGGSNDEEELDDSDDDPIYSESEVSADTTSECEGMGNRTNVQE